MNQYLLSTYTVAGAVPGAPSSPEDMQAFMQRVIELEAEMDAAGAFLFGGGLSGTDQSSVFTPAEGGATSTGGPFATGNEVLAGFYIINAASIEEAEAWAAKAAAATNHPIELRPFRATGRVADQMKG